MSSRPCHCGATQIDDLAYRRTIGSHDHSVNWCDITPGTYTPILGDAKDLQQAVFTSLGAASACWDTLRNAGRFDSTRARDIGEELLQFIKERYEVRQKVERK